MDKENLEKKFAELIGLSENESVFAFNKFKEKIVDILFVGDALKVKGLGVFQIKEQLSEEINKIKNRKKTLLFSPANEISDESSPFLTLDIQQKFSDTVEFDEKIFQLGVGKPMISLEDDGSTNSGDFRAQQIETKIDELIKQSEKISNYDIWEDYFEGKEAQSIFNDDEINDELNSYFDDDNNSKSNHLFENDFEELNEDDLLNNIFEDGNLENDEISQLTSNEIIDEKTKELEKEFFENELRDDNEKTNLDEFEEVKENSKENIQIFDEKFPNLKDEFSDIDNNIIEDFENLSKTEKQQEDEAIDLIKNVQLESENIDDILGEKQTTSNNVELDLPDNENSLVNLNNKKLPKVKKKKFNLTIILSLFLLICIAAIYYFFFYNKKFSEQLAANYESEKSEKVIEQKNDLESNVGLAKDNSIATLVDSNITKNEKLNNENTAKITTANDLISEKNKSKVEKTEQIKSDLLVQDIDPNEREVGNNIYTDGKAYSVQVSSWKQFSIAENEVKKLSNKGFSAYIVKVFVQKLNGTWHRVRIGPYSTLEEAQKNQSKL